MKKSLFAVAAVTAFAGAAQAQSSVTVYGILDVGYLQTNQRGVGTTPLTNETTSQFGNSLEQTSRLGFKGTEDLGGGASAFFTVETGLTPTSSTLGGTSLNNRQSFVGLKKNGIGQFSLGTQYTTIFDAAAITDPGQLNNMIGNVIYATTPANGNTIGTDPGTSTGAANAATGVSNGFATRAANVLKVNSDTFAGFGVNAMYTLSNANTTITNTSVGGNNNFNGWGVGANYTWNKLLVTANYQALKSVIAYGTASTVATPAPALWGGATYQGANTQDNQAYVAGTYDFGILKAYAQWVSRKATDTVNTGYYGKRTAQQIGVRSYITPVIETWASVGNGRITTFGVGQPTANFTAYQVGANYYLSKRTNFYGIFGSNQTSSTTTTSGVSANNFGLGLRHTF